MKDIITLAVYKDLVVRELPNDNPITKDEVGRIELSKSENTYEPDHYDPKKSNPPAELNHVKIKDEQIKISDFFTIVEMKERPESNNPKGRNYYRETAISVEDRFGEVKVYLFHENPTIVIGYKAYQEYLKKIKDEINDIKSFRELDLIKEIQNKDKEIASLYLRIENMKG